jgi:ferritin-like metal-binding protein YciE
MAKEKELKDLFLDTLKDIYFAEKKILSALPKMAKAAQSPKLKAAFEKHLAETDHQVERLDQVFASIDETPKGKTCDAIMGIIEEGKEIMDEYKGMPALDAGLLAAAQAVEHYEISRYGTLKTWASELGYKDAVKLLDATLKEEKIPTARSASWPSLKSTNMRRRRKPHKNKVRMYPFRPRSAGPFVVLCPIGWLPGIGQNSDMNNPGVSATLRNWNPIRNCQRSALVGLQCKFLGKDDVAHN